MYKNTRSKLGKLLYFFKYKNKYDNTDKIMSLIKPFKKNGKLPEMLILLCPFPPPINDELMQVFL